MNKISFILSVAWKEIQLISKDRGTLAVLFLMPLLLGSLTGGINIQLAGSDGDPAILLDVSLVNEDTGVFGEQLAAALSDVDVLNVETQTTADEAEQLVAEGDVTAAIIIPADFSRDIDSYTPTEIQVIVDPAQMESASIVNGIVNQAAAEVTIWGEVQHGVRSILQESGVIAGASEEIQSAVQAQTLGAIMTQLNEIRRDPAILVANENLEGASVEGWIEQFIAYVFPGFTVMFIFFIVGMSANSLLHEREVGTLRRMLAAPMPRGAVIAGKMLAFMILVCLQVVMLFSVGGIFFDMPLGRAPLGLVLLTLVVAFVATALGMMVAALVKTAKQADDIGTVMGFVLAGIGGAIPFAATPLARVGGVIGLISNLTPHAHAVEGFYRLMAENATLVEILPQVGVLLAMGVAAFAIATWRFRFEQ